LYVHVHLSPTQFDRHVLFFASVHSEMHVGWPPLPLPVTALPPPPPEQTIGLGGTMPPHCDGAPASNTGGGGGVGLHASSFWAKGKHSGACRLPSGPQLIGDVSRQRRSWLKTSPHWGACARELSQDAAHDMRSPG
jgi:hypothetical protein